MLGELMPFANKAAPELPPPPPEFHIYFPTLPSVYSNKR